MYQDLEQQIMRLRCELTRLAQIAAVDDDCALRWKRAELHRLESFRLALRSQSGGLLFRSVAVMEDPLEVLPPGR